MAKRYIDADELELEYYGLSIHGTIAVKSVLPIFADLLKKQPTADVVEVVRCPDCKHCIKDTEYSKKINMGYCEYDNTVHQKTHFCGYGERRKDDKD